MTTNPFENYGHAKGTREKPVRVTGREKAPLKKTGLEKQQEEDAKLSQLYRRTRAEELRKLLAGEYGVAIANLRKILRDFHRDKVSELVRHMESRNWYADASLETRASLLSMISVAIVRARERDGRAPFDDPLPSFNGSPAREGLFQIAKRNLRII